MNTLVTHTNPVSVRREGLGKVDFRKGHMAPVKSLYGAFHRARNGSKRAFRRAGMNPLHTGTKEADADSAQSPGSSKELG